MFVLLNDNGDPKKMNSVLAHSKFGSHFRKMDKFLEEDLINSGNLNVPRYATGMLELPPPSLTSSSSAPSKKPSSFAAAAAASGCGRVDENTLNIDDIPKCGLRLDLRAQLMEQRSCGCSRDNLIHSIPKDVFTNSNVIVQ